MPAPITATGPSIAPDNGAYAHERGMFLEMAVGDNELAAAQLQTAVQLQPRQAEPACSLALVLHKLGRTDAAETALEHALALNPRACRQAARRGLGLATDTKTKGTEKDPWLHTSL